MSNKKLVDQILRLCEKQYRKGLQHGSNLPTKYAEQFRDFGAKQHYRKALDLDGRVWSKWYHAERLSAECSMPDMAELGILLSKYADRKLEP